MPGDRIADDSGYDDWWLVDQSTDPVPQDAYSLRTMADRYNRFADDVAASATGARGVLSDPVVLSWLGRSATAFKNASEPFPGMLDSAQTAYRDLAQAFTTLGDAVDSARQQADTLLRTSNTGYDSLCAASGLPDDATRNLAVASSTFALNLLPATYASRSTLSPDRASTGWRSPTTRQARPRWRHQMRSSTGGMAPRSPSRWIP
jgi:hypothetical protein